MFRLDRLRAFQAFAELGSFTRAAERLHLSQPALHVQIRQLGEEVGAPLYRRVGRGVELTREGERLAAFARELDDRTHRFLDELHGRTPDRPVVLCAGEASTRYLLAPALQAFVRESGRLRLRVGNAERVALAVASGEAHLGFTVPGPLPEGIESRPVATIGSSVLVPDGHRLASNTAIGPSDLDGEVLIAPPPDRPHRARLERVLAGVSWSIAAEVQGWELMAQLVEVGLGLAIVNRFVPAPSGVRAIPFEGLAPVEYALLRRAGAPRVPAIDSLGEAILEVGRSWRS